MITERDGVRLPCPIVRDQKHRRAASIYVLRLTRPPQLERRSLHLHEGHPRAQGYDLKSPFQRLRERGKLTAVEIARQLGVCTTSVNHWGRAGHLRRHLYGNHDRCLYEPLGDVALVKGSGGRYGSRPPQFIPVSHD
jgi:hypothetical protein